MGAEQHNRRPGQSRRPRGRRRRSPLLEQGFSLVELAVVMVIIGLIYGIGSSTLPWIHQELETSRTRQILGEAEQALWVFARTNSRLPCPDTSNPPNGLEGSGPSAGCAATDVVGRIPYETLLLSAPVRDAHHALVSYAVFRNATAIADLVVLRNRIDTMNDVDGNNVLRPTENLCDFCEALRNGSSVVSPAHASTSTAVAGGGCGAGTLANQAYVLVGSGFEDADGDGSRFDGNNTATPPTCFASPQQGRSASYDDLVTAVGFKTLIGELCRTQVCLGPNPVGP